MARRAGCEVIYGPPHYSDPQPIAIVWVLTENTISQAYYSETEFPDILPCFQGAFAELQPHTEKSCINMANKNLAEVQESIQEENSVVFLKMYDDIEKDPTGGSDLKGGGDSGS